MAGRVRDRAGTAGAGGWSLAAATLVLTLVVAAARADNVDILLGDLENGRDYKVRLSAALSLAKLGDARAIPGFIAALEDKDKTVRGAAVVGLGKLVDSGTTQTTRDRVIKALEKVAKGDPGDTATKQAAKVLDQIKKLGIATPIVKGGLYIDLAPMSSKAKGSEGLRDLMRSTVQTGLIKLDTRIMLGWPGGKAPSQKDLDKVSVRGFHIDGNILDVTVVEKGAASLVSC